MVEVVLREVGQTQGVVVDDEEASVRGVVGVEGDRQEPLLGRHGRGDVEEGGRQDGAGADDVDHAALRRDEEALGVAGGRAHRGRCVKAAGHGLEQELLSLSGRAECEQGRGGVYATIKVHCDSLRRDPLRRDSLRQRST